MNDEIKEIDITKDLYICSPLLNTKCQKTSCYINNGSCCHTVNKEYSQEHLLDYITNLQQELEEYKDTETYSKRFLYKANKDRLNANLDLVKENERLKEENKYLDELRNANYLSWQDSLSRIEKAVEYGNSCINKDLDLETLDEPYKTTFKTAYEIHNNYLDILNGENNE